MKVLHAFYELEMQRRESVQEFWRRATALRLDLADLGKKVDDMEFIVAVVRRLPSCYNVVVTTLETMDYSNGMGGLYEALERTERRIDDREEELMVLAASTSDKGGS